jgi:hypothetical protein
LERRARDSYGTSGQVETPNGAKRQEAHRTPRGKRVAWSGNQLLLKATMYAKTAIRKEQQKTGFPKAGSALKEPVLSRI